MLTLKEKKINFLKTQIRIQMTWYEKNLRCGFVRMKFLKRAEKFATKLSRLTDFHLGCE